MTREEMIHAKGFDISGNERQYRCIDGVEEYKKIKVGVKTLDDAILDLGSLKTNLPKGH